MVSNGTVTRGQVKKSNGKVTTRLVWQGKRHALKSSGYVKNRYEMEWSKKAKRLNGLERMDNALEKT